MIDVRVCGVGNWDEFARTGNRDLGTRPPTARGVEAAGLVAAVGDQVAGITTGDRVTVHSAPLRDQGTWAEQHIAAAEHVAVLPPGVPFEAAAALPVPALTADQVIGDALQIRAGQTVLVHGAGGVTGGMLVQFGRAPWSDGDGGRLATIAADLPAAERDIAMRAVQVTRTADGSAASSSSSLRACASAARCW
jgi:NADPH:quinone reductase-like Zn-dependent oxidoreductase